MRLPDLTDEQRAIVELPLGAWLVTAPPGCGKTEVLVRRVEHLLAQSGRKRSRVLVLTFTRRAAENVIERTKRTLPEQAERVVAQRFHQFCHEVLRQQAPGRLRTVYEGKAERLLALGRALEEEGLDVPGATDLDRLLGAIELAKKKLTAQAPGGFGEEEGLKAAYLAYLSYQQRQGICDFDDLVLDVLALFRSGEWPVSVYRQLYGSVLLDEAQDLNPSQYALVSALLGPKPADVMLLADQHQSIFAFNGTDLGLLRRFAQDYSAGEKKLSLSFRCGKRIVVAANAVAPKIRRTPDRLDPGASLAEGAVELIAGEDEDTEARLVVARIRQLLDTGLPAKACHPGEERTIEPREVAILGRSRRNLLPLERELARCGLQLLTSYGREEIVSSALARTAVLFLRAVAHPSDEVLRHQLVESAKPSAAEARPATLADAIRLVPELACGRLAAVGASVVAGGDDGRLVGRTLDALREAPASLSEDEAFAFVTDREWLDGVRASLRRTLQREPTALEFAQELAVTSAVPAEGPGVRVLTMHAAKGQEFRLVAIVGMREGSFPSFYANTPKEIEEERRLAYVAITRASRVLLLSRAKTWLTSFGNHRAAVASPFLVQISAALGLDLT